MPPKWIKPQLTRLVEEAPAGPGRVHEIRYDGYQMHARIDGGKAVLLTRTGLDWSRRYRRTVEALQRLPVTSAYVDGELCALNAEGVPVFSRLQAAMDEGRTDQLVYVAFDLLFIDGDDIASLPLVDRKARLKRLFGRKIDGLLYSEHVAATVRAFGSTPASLASSGPFQSGLISPTLPATGVSGSSRSASIARSSWLSAGRIRKEADRTSVRCFSAITPRTANCTMRGEPAPE